MTIKAVRCQGCRAINPVTSTFYSSYGLNLKQPDLHQTPGGEDRKRGSDKVARGSQDEGRPC